MEMHKNLRSAVNAPNSVTIKNLNVDFDLNPIKRNFWELVVNGFVLNRRLNGFTNISVLDGGCGEGEYSYAVVDESLSRGLDINLTLADLIPKNLASAKGAIEPLKELRPKQIKIEQFLGDLRYKFPDNMYDLVLYLQLIHWMLPNEVFELVNNTSRHMNKGAILILSYATPLSDASLNNGKGGFELQESYRKRPIVKTTYPTKTKMTFFDKDSILKISAQAGLFPYAFDQLDNPYYPTRHVLKYPFTREKTSTETEIIALLKP